MGKTKKVCSKNCACCKMIQNNTKKIKENTTVCNSILELLNIGSKHEDIFSLPLSERICYKPLRKCAENITDLTILLAESLVNETIPPNPPPFIKREDKITDKWPKVGQLNLFSALEAIDEYIKTFEHNPCLNYCINFLKEITNNFSTSFIYEVCWSMPTKEQPVQVATASMYFCCTMYFSHHNQCPIEVTYTYEYLNKILTPLDEIPFREDWIMKIINTKLEFIHRNKFNIYETF